jgi:hypothetical protein
LLESVRAMMHSADIPEELWAELADTAAYLRNRLPTHANKEISPYEKWFGQKPLIGHLRTIWANAFMHVIKAKRGKLARRSTKLKMIGYHDEKKAYKLWDPVVKRIMTSRDVVFDESVVLARPPTPFSIYDEEYIVEAIIDERLDGQGSSLPC